MRKDFDSWNEKKKIIHDTHDNKLYHEREIWWCSFGANIGLDKETFQRTRKTAKDLL